MAIDPWACVALASPLWHDTANNFLLWQAEDKNDILFSPAAPILAKDPVSGKFSASAVLEQDAAGFIKGGSVSFCVDTAATGNNANLAQLQTDWTKLVTDPHTSSNPADHPQFRALATQNAQAALDIDSLWGTWAAKADQADAGTPGGQLAFSVDLTDKGALAFQKILSGDQQAAAPGVLVIKYQYLRIIPQCKVRVHIDGQKLFDAIQAELKASGQGIYYGGSADLSAAWQEARDTGAIDIQWDGGAPPPNMGADPNALLKQFLDLALKHEFDTLFTANPTVNPPKVGDTHGLFGGANFAANWTHKVDATNLNFTMEFNGATWLDERMDTTLSALFGNLNKDYLAVVEQQKSAYVIATAPVTQSVPSTQSLAITVYDGARAYAQPPAQGSGGLVVPATIAYSGGALTTDLTLSADFDNDPEFPAITVTQHLEGPQAVLPTIKPSVYRCSMVIKLLLTDANGTIIVDSNPAVDYLNLNATFSRPGEAPITQSSTTDFTQRSPIQITWAETTLYDISIEVNGALLGKVVKAEKLVPPLGGSRGNQRLTLTYSEAAGFAFE